MSKTDEELIGQHLYIERSNKECVDTNWYSADGGEEKRPLVINLHGGAFIAGDADALDTQSNRISQSWNVNVSTINYKLLKDNKYDKDYVVQEIFDTVQYFITNAETYAVDVDNIFLMGYSAGGYYAMASTLNLTENGINIKGQILCYAYHGNMPETFTNMSKTYKDKVPPALFVLADKDSFSTDSLQYEQTLRDYGITTEVKAYKNVLHGFIEQNNPEYDRLHKISCMAKSAEAEKVAREAENHIGAWIDKLATTK